MTTTLELARLAYEAYGQHANWRNYAGQPMPQWGDLGDDIQGHWLAATEAVRQDIANEIQAYEPVAHMAVCPPEIAYKAAQERMEAIARGQ